LAGGGQKPSTDITTTIMGKILFAFIPSPFQNCMNDIL
jgi:hypothetical protein